MAGEREWTQSQLDTRVPEICIVGNILRWENPSSLFSLIKIGDQKIMVFDSGQGLCRGAYINGKKAVSLIEKKNTPTFQDIFSFYGVDSFAEVINFKTSKTMDAEERMCAYFQTQPERLNNKNIVVLTAASPCNEKCASLLHDLVQSSKPNSISLRFFAPYTGQEQSDYVSSLETLAKAKIRFAPLLPSYISPETWQGYKDKKKALEWLAKYIQMEADYIKLMEEQFDL